MDATAEEAQKIELIGGSALGLLYEKTMTLLQQGADAALQSFFVYLFLGFCHHVPCKLLYIRRIVLYGFTDSCCIFLRYTLTIFLEPGADERHPIFCRDAIQVKSPDCRFIVDTFVLYQAK